MAPASSLPWPVLLLLIVLVSWCGQCSAGVDPTLGSVPALRGGQEDRHCLGFIAVNLTEDRFKLHQPYDLPPEQRYEFRDGVGRMWVYCTDKPLSPGSPTKPRSEILLNVRYTTGVWQFEDYGYVPAGTSGMSVMQVFDVSGRNTTLMLHEYGGRFMYYHDEARVVDASIYDRWFRLNVVHDVGAGALTVFVDGEDRLAVVGHSGYRHYFKFGVYTQMDPSHYMESRWRDVKVYTKLG
ncbi:citrate-binding protein-like [Miscanthus floridulus]|uniref:citrate-binding protein-like n=1 Tax=Miscanthus floridulus TaxID=154761 RepID=UPI00345B1B61